MTLTRTHYGIALALLVATFWGCVVALQSTGPNYFFGILSTLCIGGLVWAAAARLNDAERSAWWASLVLVPGFGLLVLVALGFLPGGRAGGSDRR